MIKFTVYRIPSSVGLSVITMLVQQQVWFAVQHEADHISVTMYPDDRSAMEEALSDVDRNMHVSLSVTTDAPGVPTNAQLEAGTVWVEKNWDIDDNIPEIYGKVEQLTPRHTWMPYALNGLIFAWQDLTRRERAIVVQCVHHDNWLRMHELAKEHTA